MFTRLCYSQTLARGELATDVVFREKSLHTREKKALENLGLIKRFVLSILKIVKEYYNMSFRYIRRKIGRNLEKEIPVSFATLKRMYEVGNENFSFENNAKD